MRRSSRVHSVQNRFSLLLALAVFAGAGVAHAQPGLSPAATTLRPSVQALATVPDVPPTLRAGDARVAADGRVVADYRLTTAPRPGTPEIAARAYLAAQAARYGLPAGLAGLRLDTVIAGRFDAHVAFSQTADGLSIYGAGLRVSLAADGRVLFVTSTVAPEAFGALVPAFALTAGEAVQRVQQGVLSVAADVEVVRRAAFRVAGGLRPAFVLRARPRAVAVEWEVVLDGATGAVLALAERSIGHRENVSAPSFADAWRRATGPEAASERRTGEAPGVGPRPVPPARMRGNGAEGAITPGASPLPLPNVGGHAGAPALVDGRGLVFDPDPLTTAGVAYGGAYSDNNDADTPELNAQRREVVLPALTQRNGRYYLEGPYVQLTGDPIQGLAAVVPDEADPAAFRYTRADDRFEAVMAYFHTDKSQRRVQALAIGRPIRERPVRINPQGLTEDDSRYLPGSNAIVFGKGGIDDAEDADVIWHEYAHALLDDQQPDLQLSTEGRALHEGWADYWAASYSRRVQESGAGQGDWRKVYTWDGNNGCWQGRRLDHPGLYSATDRSRMAYPASPGCGALGTVYQWGLLWGTTLMEVYDALGADVTDRLTLASFAYLGHAAGTTPAAPPMEVAAEALIAADRALYGGTHEGVLVGKLAARGFVDAADYGPVLIHAPLASTEQQGGTREVIVEADGRASPVQRVVLVYRVDGGAAQTVELAPQGGTRYTGDLPLPAGPAQIIYYIEATDAAGRITRLPAAAATPPTYAFFSGPDTTPPALAHTPFVALAVQALPPLFAATASDALGVASVTVEYAIRRNGVERGAGTVALTREADGVWRGRPATFPAVAFGDTLVYRIVARDRAAAANTATSPRYAVPLVDTGVLGLFSGDAEAGVTLTGAWTQGPPAYGLRVARTPSNVFSTARTVPYPATRGTSTLELRAFDLSTAPATLSFWYWTDVERGGQCRTVCDGGRVEVSTATGLWAPLEIEGGYPDTVDARFGGGLAGQPVLPGGSYGWQRAIARLPQGGAVRVRFVFGTDEGNTYTSTYGFAGLALDSIAVTTARPGPGRLPTTVEGTATGPLAVGTPVPLHVRVDVPDLVRVVAVVDLVRAGLVVQSDSVRLRQRPDSLTVFEAGPLALGTRAGDVVRTRFRLTTAGGARVELPATPVERAVRTFARTNALVGAAESGVWHALGAGFSAYRPSDTAPAVMRDRSSLVLAPFDLPANADALALVVRHRYRLGTPGPDTPAGNVKVSVDDGHTWTVLSGAYPVAALPDGHPLEGQSAFAGTSPGDTLVTRFSLSAYAGQQVRLRFDLGHAQGLDLGQTWTIDRVTVEATTPAQDFDTPRTFGLSAPFPNPFGARLSFAYTLAEAAVVEAALFDVLGRRVRTVTSAGMQEPGTYPLTLDTGDLASGLYVLHLRAGAATLTRTVTKAR